MNHILKIFQRFIVLIKGQKNKSASFSEPVDLEYLLEFH
jgi:hypothetical protein